jgi:hypothetical protein
LRQLLLSPEFCALQIVHPAGGLAWHWTRHAPMVPASAETDAEPDELELDDEELELDDEELELDDEELELAGASVLPDDEFPSSEVDSPPP